ncbi:MAG: hypothetical protein R6U20_07600 [Longimonas sp.]|uniref:hypothetical protein n=1 Tax=Longimonas sp. TaxID=2039626 RepID=UPI00397625E4
MYTLLAFGVVVYIVRDMLRTWTKTRAEATSDAALRAHVATLEEEVDRQQDALQTDIAVLREEQDRMTTRLEHLETIVTHEAWERWGEDTSTHIDPPDQRPDASASEIAAQWARKMRS